jgi:hypothetical protein
MSKISSNDWTVIAFFAMFAVAAVALAVVAGWMDFDQNKVITECIRAGKTWKDGNCG